VRTLVFTEVTAIGAGEVAEAAFVRFPALVEGRDVCLELGVRCSRVAAAITHIWAFAGVCALMVIFRLVRREGLGAAWIAAGVGAIAGVAEEVSRQLRALFEVFGRGVAVFPLAEAGGAVVDVHGLGVLVQGFGTREALEAQDAWGMLPTGLRQ